jgi:hypothetical protein
MHAAQVLDLLPVQGGWRDLLGAPRAPLIFLNPCFARALMSDGGLVLQNGHAAHFEHELHEEAHGGHHH